MPDAAEVLQDTPPLAHSYRINAQNARAMALRSHAARKQRKAAEALAAALPPQVASSVLVSPARVAQIEAEMDATLAAFKDAKLPKDRRDLSAALDKLAEVWSLFTGHERPGVRKASRRPTSTRPAAIVPLDPEAV